MESHLDEQADIYSHYQLRAPSNSSFDFNNTSSFDVTANFSKQDNMLKSISPQTPIFTVWRYTKLQVSLPIHLTPRSNHTR